MADKTLLIVGGIAVVAIGAYIFTRPRVTTPPIYYRPVPQTANTATQIANDANAASSLVNAAGNLISSLNNGASDDDPGSDPNYYGSDPMNGVAGVPLGAL